MRSGMCTFVESAGTHIQAKIGFGADQLAPFHELVGAKLVAFYTDPSQLWSKDLSVGRLPLEIARKIHC
jgi:hypothetical protein